MEKFQTFLKKKSEKTAYLSRFGEIAKSTASQDIEKMKINWPDFELGSIYSERHEHIMKSKFLSLDKKTLPEEISDDLRADIARQRLDAFERASKKSERSIYREALSITGENFAIPSWAILRDESKTLSPCGQIARLSFPEQFSSRREQRIEKIVEGAKNSFNNNLEGISEPLLQGFNNIRPLNVIAVVDASEEVVKGFFRNYLEVCRLNPKNPFYAWVIAQSKSEHPILTLRNRAKPIKPLCGVGRAERPFIVEIEGTTYICEGDDAEAMFFSLRNKEKFKYCVAIKALRNFIDNSDIARIVDETEIEEVSVTIIDEPPKPEIIDGLKREVLSSLSDETLEALRGKGIVPNYIIDDVIGMKSFWATLPRTAQIFQLHGVEEREILLKEHEAKRSEFLKRIKDAVGIVDPVGLFQQEYISALSDVDSDEDLFGFMEEDAEEHVSVASEESLQIDSHALDYAPEQEDVVDSLQWEPRFISELRLWPQYRIYWKPP